MLLVRFAYLPAGTLGRLHSSEGQLQLFTLERPWQNNRPFVSCIPEGNYGLRRFDGSKWKGVLEVEDVFGRTAILIHPANQPVELAGCIAPGMDWNIEKNIPTVQRSRDALSVVMDWFSAGDNTLSIQSEDSLR